MAYIEIEGLSKVYNVGRADELTALADVSLSIDSGEVAVLTGSSGSGKTSLLSLIGCMARPTQGKVIIAGKDVAKLPERFLTAVRRKRFGFIFQQFNLIRDVSVLENVLLPLYPLDLGMSAMKDKAMPILEKLKISHKKNLKVKNLSGGEQQRVAIARALINEPEVIIADEPTAHLDRRLAQEFLDILEVLNHEGKTIVIATHDPFVYDNRLVGKTVSMRDGRIEGVTIH
ncbi:ABC transporter ATP-binding protein [Desulforhopalus sp. IMCC35007]|uniref:ABC transporter ATP-binding protein n=1 Tax=Desulforhopalus sp. IMCC35007 TaxID=2569543 RepID=UPI0010AE37ED|nr:ABC transporter ATP-binding protein [Desulforhopalus sp. IMCC35007]TKB07281.1 ABC transporter ATP-binding protein [Desulforhopalus sp. IMCC35007]